MAISPIAPPPQHRTAFRIFGKARMLSLVALLVLFSLCALFAWSTRDAMANLPFLMSQTGKGRLVNGEKPLVDLSSWQTAQALAPLAVTAEEAEFARDAERLADHDVDQAFASALRLASLKEEHRTLTGKALEISQKITQLEGMIKQDQALVESLGGKAGPAAAGSKADAQQAGDGDDLDVAKAQLGLDTDELEDARREFARASGDESSRIQQELAAHEASMQEYDKQAQAGGQIAVIAVRQQGTLARRIKAWFDQRSRFQLLQQALKQTQANIATLTSQYNTLEAQVNAAGSGGAANGTNTLADIKDRASERQVLSIYDDRIQTEQQLAAVYGRWSDQVLLQHRIVLHLILQSLALILVILISMLLADALVRLLMARPNLDRRQMHTLRTIFEVSIQVLGALLILLVIFGSPQQTPTILGLATAALTIALQDFILAFLGWFVLMGKNGIHVGDWVEINGVGGEVIEVGLFSTTLLETGTLADKGLPTGRRIAFINSFAIRGQFFNFSTAGQWMWDEISTTMPAGSDIHAVAENMHKMVEEETAENVHAAEQEWKRGAHGDSLSRFSAAPVVNLRPSGGGATEVEVRYVTRASGRFEMRNRLYQRMVDLQQAVSARPAVAQ